MPNQCVKQCTTALSPVKTLECSFGIEHFCQRLGSFSNEQRVLGRRFPVHRRGIELRRITLRAYCLVRALGLAICGLQLTDSSKSCACATLFETQNRTFVGQG